MSADIEQRVIETIARTRAVPPEQVTSGATFEELGMTSLDALALIYELEEEFDISMPNEEAMGLRDVRQAIETVRRLLSPESAESSPAPSPESPGAAGAGGAGGERT